MTMYPKGKNLIRITALLLLSSVVFAIGEKTFTWTPPTQYDDGSNLPQSEIASYDIECDGALLANILNVPLDTDTYQAPSGTFAVGSHSCVAYTWSIDGVRSVASNATNFTVAPGVPNPPILAVQ